jgi:predicted TIM-barrel fold metal-dependent hydrolase
MLRGRECQMADEAAVMLISSDGHVVAPMAEYRPYLEQRYQADFDDFLVEWNKRGSKNSEPQNLATRLDPELVDQWAAVMVETGRLAHFGNAHDRLGEMDREGVTAEILFPDFGLPFETYHNLQSDQSGLRYVEEGNYQEYKRAGRRAFNRWLADFVSVAPERWAGMAPVSWQQDPEQIIAEIREVHASGLRGITLPVFERDRPVYHAQWEPVWNVLEELGMVINNHMGISATCGYSATDRSTEVSAPAPHSALNIRILVPELVFFTQNLLSHLIWGGVLERHPSLNFVFTEMGSFWPVPMLEMMDYTYDKSYFRTDYKHVIPLKPTEYFERQCYLGSSLIGHAEIGARHQIGVDHMMVGCDIPHHEGMIEKTTRNYLQAVFGPEDVSRDEARRMLGETALKVFNFDEQKLRPIADRLNLQLGEILTPPEKDLYPRGDVHKPLSLV